MTTIPLWVAFVAGIVLTVILSVAVFGMGHGMEISSAGKMSNCPFMGGTAVVCQMNIFGHIAAWQSAFTAQVKIFVPILLSALLIFYWFASTVRKNQEGSLLRLYAREKTHNIFNHLVTAFSQGILNPKIYELAIAL